MLRLSVFCLFLGILAISLGLFQVIDLSFEAGRLLFLIFLSLAVITFIGKLVSERST